MTDGLISDIAAPDHSAGSGRVQPPDPRRDRFLEALLRGDRRAGLDVARSVLEEHGVLALCDELVRQAMYEIGERWMAGSLSVAHEHLATATLEAVMGALYSAIPWKPVSPTANRLVAACPEGERHSIGLRLVSDVLLLEGRWRILFLGADLPTDGLIEIVNDLRASGVLLSVSLPEHLAGALRAAERIMAETHAALVVLGGRAARAAPGPSDRGPLIGASAGEALRIVRETLG